MKTKEKKNMLKCKTKQKNYAKQTKPKKQTKPNKKKKVKNNEKHTHKNLKKKLIMFNIIQT